MITITDKEIYSDQGKYVHRIGTEIYFKRCSKLAGDTQEMFVEVDSIPDPPTEEETQRRKEVEDKVKSMLFYAEIPKVINTMDIPDQDSLVVKDLYPAWSEFIGKELPKGHKVNYGDSLYKVIQTVNQVLEHQTPDLVPANYTPIDEEHEGTLEDPIPYVQMMAFEKGKYYSQYGETYLCILTTITGYPNDLKDLPTIVQKVEK